MRNWGWGGENWKGPMPDQFESSRIKGQKHTKNILNACIGIMCSHFLGGWNLNFDPNF